MVCADIRQILSDKFRSLTAADFKKAVDNGILGKYGEVYTVSVCSVVDWLNAYLIDPDRLAAMHNANKAVAALPEKATATDAEYSAMMRQSVYDKYRAYCAKGTFLDVHSVSYDYLNRIGVLNPTPEEKNAIYARHIKSENGRAEIKERKGIKPIGVQLYEIAQSNAVARCKYYFLAKFFEDVKNSGGDITDYV